MKALTLVMGLFVGSLLLPAAATAQGDACSGQYGSCMDHCSSRPQSLQESCSRTCEANTNQCYQGLYSRAASGAQPQANASAQGEAAEAHDQAKPAKKKKR